MGLFGIILMLIANVSIMYNFKRALGVSFVLYFLTFFVGLAVGAMSKQDMSSLNTISESFWYIGMVTAVVLTVVCSLWYFRTSTVVATAKSGLFFGLTTVLLSIVLDTVLFTIGNTQGANVDLAEYYGDVRFWIIALLVIVTAKVVGHMKRPKVQIV